MFHQNAFYFRESFALGRIAWGRLLTICLLLIPFLFVVSVSC
jgi:hypothetical protein